MDIVHDVIVREFPKLILENYPYELLEAYPYDLLLYNLEEVLKSGEFKLHFRQKLPNEFISKDGKKMVADIPLETFEDIIVSLEFHSYDIDYERETIFNAYQAELHKEHQKHVITVVFSMKYDEHKLISHKINPYDGFTMLIISLKALNQKQTLNNSLYKIKNNIHMSNKEKALFLLSPMMDDKNKIGALDILMKNYYRIINLTQNELEDMETIIWLYIEKWCKREFMDDEGGSDMAVLTPGAKEIKEKIYEQGKGEGTGEGFKKSLKAIDMIKKGSSLEDISKETGLTKIQLNQLCSLIL